MVAVTANRELQGGVFEDQEFTLEGLDAEALEAKVLLFLEAITRRRIAGRNV